MSVPGDRKYLETHEWHLVESSLVTVGITQLAADQLSDVTYVDLPTTGTKLKAGDVFGEIESVKATSELYSGVGGEVVETNDQLEDQPELVNNEPYDNGWMVRIKADDLGDIEKMLSAEQYEARYPPEA